MLASTISGPSTFGRKWRQISLRDRQAEDALGIDERLMAQRQGLRPRHAAELRNEQDGDDEQQIAEAGAVERDQPHGEDDGADRS